MKTKIFRIISIIGLVILLLAVGTVVAGTIAKSNLARKYPAPGQLVDVGGYKMHINCVGQGSPTVILEAGLGDSSLIWTYVQPEIAKTNRVCSYDRAGYGWSDAGPYPRTALNEVQELHTLLANANLTGPFVMVGHSLGGVNVRVYAHQHPDEVAGMVLVDSAHEDQTLFPEIQKINEQGLKQLTLLKFLSYSGLMALAPQNIPNPGLPEDVYAQYQAINVSNKNNDTYAAEMTTGKDSFAEVRSLNISSFENMPLIVLSRGRWDPIPFITESESQKSWKIWQEIQSRLVCLSSESKQVIAEQSEHYIHIDQPDLVINAIQEVVDSIQK